MFGNAWMFRLRSDNNNGDISCSRSEVIGCGFSPWNLRTPRNQVFSFSLSRHHLDTGTSLPASAGVIGAGNADTVAIRESQRSNYDQTAKIITLCVLFLTFSNFEFARIRIQYIVKS